MFGSKSKSLLTTVVTFNKKSLPRTFTQSSNLMNSFKVQDLKDFEKNVKNASTPIIVDFYATWCNPCKILTPRLETVIDEMKGKVVLAKVDIDELTDLAMDYEISSVPVLIAMRNGKEENRMVGVQDLDKLRTFISNLVEKQSAVKNS